MRRWESSATLSLLSLAFAGSVAAQAPSLSLSGASGAPGATVTLAVSLNLGTGTAPSSVQWDLDYSTSDLSLASGTYDATGAAASEAGKSVHCNSIAAGDVRCIISGINTTGIGNGVVATVRFQIHPGTTDTSTPVSMVSAAASNGSANPLSIADSGATVTIDQPAAAGLSSLDCVPASVTPPASSTCTVTLNGIASSSKTVSLASGALAATVPASVIITAGLSNAAFTVSTTAVSASTPAEITATLGSGSADFSLTLTPTSACTYSLSAAAASVGSSAGNGSLNVVASAGCPWTVSNPSNFITITAGGSGTGNGTVYYSLAANSGDSRTGTLTIASRTFTVTQAGQTSAGLAFYPLTPCRIADTRVGSGFSGAFGAPYLSGGATRSFSMPASSCSVPDTARGYSLNFGAIPHGPLQYLTTWAAGLPLPQVATLGSPNGDAVSNAALVPAGTSGAISAYASDDTDLIIDINGYFAPPGSAHDMALYAITPCRVADTRTGSGFSGAFGAPSLSADIARTLPLPASACSLPATAAAYSLNIGVVPYAALEYLTSWPAGLQLPVVGTLGSPEGLQVSNAAIVRAGSAGAISLYASAETDVIVDSNGYFAAPGSANALYFYSLTPCRIADTRSNSGSGLTGAFGPPSLTAGATREFPLRSSSCGIPASAKAYSLNIGVVTPGPLQYLTVWPAGRSMPTVGTLSAPGVGIVSDAAIVPAGANGGINIFVSDATDVIIDIDGYFAP